MCDCHSYNKPNLGGKRSEIVLNAPSWSSKKTICIDACIADTIQMLWKNGIETLGCCCGHGKKCPSVVIAESMNGAKVYKLLKANDDREWEVLQWKLVLIKPKGNEDGNKN